MYRKIITYILLLSATIVQAQQITLVKSHRAYDPFGSLPPGNYSGITSLGDNQYVLVSDKGNTDGFHLLSIFSQNNGAVNSVRYDGFKDWKETGGDLEDIVYVPSSNTLFIASEAHTVVREFSLDGHPTGRELAVPQIFSQHAPNLGVEALAYNSVTERFWLTSESTLISDLALKDTNHSSPLRLRLQSFTSDLQPASQYAYLTDSPKFLLGGRSSSAGRAHFSRKKKQGTHLFGVPAIVAADNGLLLVLEREVYIPRWKMGAWLVCKIYVVNPQQSEAVNNDERLGEGTPWMKKTLLCQWKTVIHPFCHSFANYEGMCLSPRRPDGTQLLLLVSDSQDQYGDMLTDWVKSIVVRIE